MCLTVIPSCSANLTSCSIVLQQTLCGSIPTQEADPVGITAADPAPTELTVFILDWELCHVSSYIFDLGQMLAELYFLYHFRSSPCIPILLNNFLSGYGNIDNRDAFNILIHCGVHLVVWSWRTPGLGNEGQIRECVQFGHDIIHHAYTCNSHWFVTGIFHHFFKDEA